MQMYFKEVDEDNRVIYALLEPRRPCLVLAYLSFNDDFGSPLNDYYYFGVDDPVGAILARDAMDFLPQKCVDVLNTRKMASYIVETYEFDDDSSFPTGFSIFIDTEHFGYMLADCSFGMEDGFATSDTSGVVTFGFARDINNRRKYNLCFIGPSPNSNLGVDDLSGYSLTVEKTKMFGFDELSMSEKLELYLYDVLLRYLSP